MKVPLGLIQQAASRSQLWEVLIIISSYQLNTFPAGPLLSAMGLIQFLYFNCIINSLIDFVAHDTHIPPNLHL